MGLLSNGRVRAFHCGGLGTWAWLSCSMWNLPRSGIELLSPALVAGFLTAGPPRKSYFFKKKIFFLFYKIKLGIVELCVCFSCIQGGKKIDTT